MPPVGLCLDDVAELRHAERLSGPPMSTTECQKTWTSAVETCASYIDFFLAVTIQSPRTLVVTTTFLDDVADHHRQVQVFQCEQMRNRLLAQDLVEECNWCLLCDVRLGIRSWCRRASIFV